MVKNVNAMVCFLKEAMKIDDRATTKTVEIVANDIGRYITPMMNASTIVEGTFSRTFQ